MKRSSFVRFQLLLLLIVAGLLVWQSQRGLRIPSGVVDMAPDDVGSLTRETFELAEPTMLHIRLVGSMETETGDVPAAYGWIVRDGGGPIWLPDATRSERRGTRFELVDSVAAGAGVYTAYFASYGATLRSRGGRAPLGLRPHWTNDARHWRFVVQRAGPAPDGAVLPDPISSGGESVWQSGPVSSQKRSEVLLQVTEPSDLQMDGIAEICREQACDVIRLEDALHGAAVWAVTTENSVPAGGYAQNRTFSDLVRFEAGLYRAVVQTDRTHAYDDWRANPPYMPEFWGLRIAASPGTVHAFDPWETTPIVAFTEVGDDELLKAVIQVNRSFPVAVAAMGEIGSGGTRYDYAWLERGPERDLIWEMTDAEAGSAGGDRSNREETVFLTLDPGRYTLTYQSDGSHSFTDWSRSRPDFPERWGVSLFSLEPGGVDTSAVQVIDRVRVSPGDGTGDVVETDGARPVPVDTLGLDVLFEAVGLGNDQERNASISLDRQTTLRIVALGEISEAGRYDYGWIDTAGGEFVWEMTYQNTVRVDGHSSNRLFNGTITLEPGTYRVHYKTDFSHAVGDFGDGTPPDPDAWGIRVYRLPN